VSKGSKIAARLERKNSMKDLMSKMGDDLLSAQRKTILQATLKVHEIAVKSLQDNTSGTPQKRCKPTRDVVASLPGTPPNTDTGRAVQSMGFEFENEGLAGVVGTNLKYLAWFEFGTQKVAARPWLQPAYWSVINSGMIATLLLKETKDALK
jgi:phage gpG-like protein